MLDLKELNLANFISSTLYHVLTVTHNEMRDKLKKNTPVKIFWKPWFGTDLRLGVILTRKHV